MKHDQVRKLIGDAAVRIEAMIQRQRRVRELLERPDLLAEKLIIRVLAFVTYGSHNRALVRMTVIPGRRSSLKKCPKPDPREMDDDNRQQRDKELAGLECVFERAGQTKHRQDALPIDSIDHDAVGFRHQHMITRLRP